MSMEVLKSGQFPVSCEEEGSGNRVFSSGFDSAGSSYRASMIGSSDISTGSSLVSMLCCSGNSVFVIGDKLPKFGFFGNGGCGDGELCKMSGSSKGLKC